MVGRNELERRAGPGLAREVAAQLVHPLALLLWAAAGLAFAGRPPEPSVPVTGQPGVAGGARATVEAEAFQEEESWPPAS